MLSVLYLTVIPSPYKVSFFNELGKYCDLTVIFDKSQSNIRESDWLDYNFKEFKGVTLNENKSELLKHFQDYKYDIIIVANYSTIIGIIAMMYLKIKKIPYIISVDGGLINYDESKLKKNFKRLLISNADTWLSTGKITNEYLTYYGAKQEAIQKYPFTTMKKLDIIEKPLTVNEKKEIRNKLQIPYKNMILSVGSFIPRKGFDILIEAAKYFKEDTGVYIIGGSPIEEYLILMDRYKINNVHFINFLEYSELKKYYLAADIFVFPTRQDVWGLVINEAIANGLPVITTTSCVAGVEMIAEGVNGYLVPKDDVEQIVEKTNKILNNDSLRRNMALNSLDEAQGYTIENMAEITFNMLKNMN